MAVQKQSTGKEKRPLSRGFSLRIFQDQYQALGALVAQKATSVPIEIRTCLDEALFPERPSFGLCSDIATGENPAQTKSSS
jgi:hypothetical protein